MVEVSISQPTSLFPSAQNVFSITQQSLRNMCVIVCVCVKAYVSFCELNCLSRDTLVCAYVCVIPSVYIAAPSVVWNTTRI